jgi:hypothetical protein
MSGWIDRPTNVRFKKASMPPRSAIATAMVSAASLPMAMSSLSDQLS